MSSLRRWSFALTALLLGGRAHAAMRVDSFATAPTAAEIASFEDEIKGLEPGANGNITPTNDWAQHASGQRTMAMGLVYEMTHDRIVLDRMLVFCDELLATRNDLAAAPVGQHVIWTGAIEPVWPNATTAPIGTGGEQGDAIGHLGYCARLVLETPELANVPLADPHGYGATYHQRAQRFVSEADHSLDEHVFAELLDLSDRDRMYWAAGNPYQTGSVPWNQQVMFDYALQNLAAAHRLLGDDPARAARYDAIVQSSLDWFFSGEPGAAAPYQTPGGDTAYLWAYRPPSGTEDWSHSNLDIQGLYRAYASGRYDVTEAQMLPLANTFLDVIRRGPNDYAGRVDGTDGGGNSAPTTSVRPNWYVAALFRPNDYLTIVSEDLSEGGTTGDITRFSTFLWVKCKLHSAECVLPVAPPAEGMDAGVADAGAADAGAAAADAGPAAGDDLATGGCGCQVGAGGGAPRGACVGALVLVALVQRSRRRRWRG